MSSADPGGGETGLEPVQCDIEGFDVWASQHEVIVKKRAATFGEWCSILPFAIAAPALGIVGALTALIPAYCALWPKPEYDMPLWLSVVWPVIFALGAGVCFWGFKCCLVVLLPVVRRIASGSDSVICESSIWGFTYRRKTLQRPVVLVADVYESRGDWLSNMYLRAADRRRFPVTIPTAIASSKSEAKGKVDPLAKAITTRLETSITGLGQSEPRRQRVNE